MGALAKSCNTYNHTRSKCLVIQVPAASSGEEQMRALYQRAVQLHPDTRKLFPLVCCRSLLRQLRALSVLSLLLLLRQEVMRYRLPRLSLVLSVLVPRLSLVLSVLVPRLSLMLSVLVPQLSLMPSVLVPRLYLMLSVLVPRLYLCPDCP